MTEEPSMPCIYWREETAHALSSSPGLAYVGYMSKHPDTRLPVQLHIHLPNALCFAVRQVNLKSTTNRYSRGIVGYGAWIAACLMIKTRRAIYSADSDLVKLPFYTARMDLPELNPRNCYIHHAIKTLALLNTLSF